MKEKLYKMVISNKEDNTTIYFKKNIQAKDILKYIDFFYNNNMQNFANYIFITQD